MWNNKKRRILVILGIVLAAMFTFPPVEEHVLAGSYYRRVVLTGHAGYKFILDVGYNNNEKRTETINLPLLVIQIIVAVGLGVIFLLVADRDKDL